MSETPADVAYRRFLPWRRSFEIGFWLIAIAVNCTANSVTTLMDIRRSESDIRSWEPAVWEISSGLLWLAVLIPAIAWFTRRFPLHWDNWRRQMPWYLLASVALAVVHVAGMVALRVLI